MGQQVGRVRIPAAIAPETKWSNR